MCIRWSSNDKVDHTTESRGDSKTVKWLKVGEWFGVEPFDTINETENVVWSNPGLKPFAQGLHWPDWRLYVNRFKNQFLSYKLVELRDERVQG